MRSARDGKFPTVRWEQAIVSFRPAPGPTHPISNAAAALVFAFVGERVVLADIRGRGWCIPGGRVEPRESPSEAAIREAYEEAGLTLSSLSYLGDTVEIAPDGSARVLAVSFTANVTRSDPVPAESESCGVRLATREETPECYYRWDPLMAAMFDYAWVVHDREEQLHGPVGRLIRPLDC